MAVESLSDIIGEQNRDDKRWRAVRLAKDGMCNEQIAKEMGMSYGSICGYLYEGRKAGIFIDNRPGRDWPPLHITILDRLGYDLRDEALRRLISPTQLAQQIIDTVVRENLFDAVLDKPIRKRRRAEPPAQPDLAKGE